MIKNRYCLPIIKNTKKEVLNELNIKGYDCYEVWVDYIKDLDEGFIVSLVKKFQGKLIFVFRRQNLVPIKLSLERRKNLISLLSKFPVFLDIDFLTQHEELEFLRKSRKLKLILSYHNYKETPKLDYLANLTTKMKRYNSDIYKFAAFCQTEQDALILLGLLLKLKEQKLKYIVLGIGKMGQITRIIGQAWGNEFNFAPVDLKEKSAEGQLTKSQLENIFKEIK